MKQIFCLFLIFTSTKGFANCELSKKQLVLFSMMDFKEFDQTSDSGHRKLSLAGCDISAGLALDFYYTEKRLSLLDWQKRTLLFHAGQAYAFSGSYKSALSRFKQTKNTEEEEVPFLNWNDYVEATIAFLEKDLIQLYKSRERMRSNPTSGNRINLKVVDAFIKCFNKSYKEVYSKLCSD